MRKIFSSGLMLFISLWTMTAMAERAKTLDDKIREKIGKQYFIKTSHGSTYADVQGEGAETLVFVPGLGIPTRVTYAKQQELAAHYRVVTFDLYGRGYTDRPKVTYNPQLFEQQLTDVLKALDIEGPIHLVGVSMGGAISTYFANRHPERIKSLTLMAPAGLPMKLPLTSELAKLPLLGDVLMQAIGKKTLLENFKKGFVGEPTKEATAIFLEQFEYRGYLEAMLSTLRNFPLNDMESEYQAWAEKNKPTLIVWGTEDQVVPFSLSPRLGELIPEAKVVPVSGAGHAFTYEFSELVNAALLDFLSVLPH